jgi:hypothetical protein
MGFNITCSFPIFERDDWELIVLLHRSQLTYLGAYCVLFCSRTAVRVITGNSPPDPGKRSVVDTGAHEVGRVNAASLKPSRKMSE